jgi:hypothetical protein
LGVHSGDGDGEQRMTPGSPDLSGALARLRGALEREFTGNRYYRASQELAELRELLGAKEAGAGRRDQPSEDYAAAIRALARKAEGELSGNRFYLVRSKLEFLAFLGEVTKITVLAAAPAAVLVQKRARDFDELAAASAARVAETAHALGISIAATAAKQPETLADGELERRSSEPCMLAEFEAVREVAPPGLPPEAVPPTVTAQTSPDLGPPAAPVAARNGARESFKGAAEKSRAASARDAAAAADDRASAAAGETLASRKLVFGLWLDALFGRNRKP